MWVLDPEIEETLRKAYRVIKALILYTYRFMA